nr:uncharacterized protein LOC127346796 [Lolium perenne]
MRAFEPSCSAEDEEAEAEGRCAAPDPLPPAPARCPPSRSSSGSVGPSTPCASTTPTATSGRDAPRAFERRESRFYRDLQPRAPAIPPPRRSTYSKALGSSASPPVPRFEPGDYAEDEDIAMLAAKLEHAAPALMARDFIPDSVLSTVTKLVED